MITISLLCLILALICFIIAAVSIPTGRISTVALGLAFWVAAELLAGGHLSLR
jgi:hypothetical protein